MQGEGEDVSGKNIEKDLNMNKNPLLRVLSSGKVVGNQKQSADWNVVKENRKFKHNIIESGDNRVNMGKELLVSTKNNDQGNVNTSNAFAIRQGEIYQENREVEILSGKENSNLNLNQNLKLSSKKTIEYAKNWVLQSFGKVLNAHGNKVKDVVQVIGGIKYLEPLQGMENRP